MFHGIPRRHMPNNCLVISVVGTTVHMSNYRGACHGAPRANSRETHGTLPSASHKQHHRARRHAVAHHGRAFNMEYCFPGERVRGTNKILKYILRS